MCLLAKLTLSVCVCVYTWHDYFKENGDRNKEKEMKEEKGVILRFHVMILQCKMRDWGGCTNQDK